MTCILQGDFVQTDGSEYALKEALFTKGPMTVSVDASPDSFVFYSSGVYNNTQCKTEYSGTMLLLFLSCCFPRHSQIVRAVSALAVKRRDIILYYIYLLCYIILYYITLYCII